MPWLFVRRGDRSCFALRLELGDSRKKGSTMLHDRSRNLRAGGAMAIQTRYCDAAWRRRKRTLHITGQRVSGLVVRTGRTAPSVNDLWSLMSAALPEINSQQEAWKELCRWFTSRWPGQTFLAFLDGRIRGEFSLVSALNELPSNEKQSGRRWMIENKLTLSPQGDVPAHWDEGGSAVVVRQSKDRSLGAFDEVRELLKQLVFAPSAETESGGEDAHLVGLYRERSAISTGGIVERLPSNSLVFRAGMWSDRAALQRGSLPTVPEPVPGVIGDPHFVLGTISHDNFLVHELFLTMAPDGRIRCLSWSRPTLENFRLQQPLIAKMLDNAKALRGQDRTTTEND